MFIFAIRQRESWSWVIWLAAGLAGVEEAWRILRNRRKVGGDSVTVVTIRDRGGEVAGYLAAYLLPFLGGKAQGWDWAAYAVFFGVLLAVFLQSNLALFNPTLYVVGWRVYVGELAENGGETLLIARARPRPGERVSVVALPGGWMLK
jgi:hypothetical protein